MIRCQLLTGGTDKEKLKKIGKFLEKHTNSAPSLFEPNPDLFSLFPEKSIGILEIKKLISFLSRKPFSKDVKVVLIFEADKLTIPAQNALLKTLEEPPKDSFIFLLTDRSFAFLPTILSRVESVKIVSKQKSKSNLKQQDKVKEILKQVLNQTPGERIALSLELAKSKNDVEKLCTNLLTFLRIFLRKRLELESNDSEKNLSLIQINKMIKDVENARKMLDANVNFHLVVEDMLLNFPKLEK
ncbi:hypothetical protein KKF11_03575 [Patescibacteria group bacterium]|nr:hypothetical protein [Patescibacteria group bacterium]